MAAYSKHFSTKRTPQSQPVPGKKMIPNNTGGHAFSIGDWGRLRRFLILGTEGGTYYQGEKELTIENCNAVLACIANDGMRVVRECTEVSIKGLAPKNDPAIFVLAMCSSFGDNRTRHAAFEAMPSVCRIGTHLFTFVEYREAFAGWGRGMRRAVRNWYMGKKVEGLIYQLLKYRQRNGWAQRDILRLAHAKPDSPERDSAFAFAVNKTKEPLDDRIAAFIEAQTAPKPRLLELIEKFSLSREMIPTEHLNDPDVQHVMLPNLGLTALIRNLGNMSKSGLIKPLSKAEGEIYSRMQNQEEWSKALVHPFSILLALKTYGRGRGFRGTGEWLTSPRLMDALNDAFYYSFNYTQGAGKRFLLGIDVSASMGNPINDSPISAAEAAGAMAMITLKTEDKVYAHGFAGDFKDLKLSPKMRLDDVLKRVYDSNFGRTDCSLPMVWALSNKIEVDTFVVYTDNETWAGNIHPFQALRQYRDRMGINSKMVVCAFSATDCSIADKNDPGMLDCVGLDASLPNIIKEFSAGNI